jgi:hypothetical protein
MYSYQIHLDHSLSETHPDFTLVCAGSKDIKIKQCAKWKVAWSGGYPGDRQSSIVHTCWHNTAKPSSSSEILTLEKASDKSR